VPPLFRLYNQVLALKPSTQYKTLLNSVRFLKNKILCRHAKSDRHNTPVHLHKGRLF